MRFSAYPSPRTKLASLVKGRWIDGKPQTVALLHFYLRYIRLFYSPNFLPSRRRDCLTTIPRPAPTLPKPHYPSKIANTLASLVKSEVLSPERIRATTRGIASPPSLAPHQPFQKPYYPLRIANTLALLAPPVTPNTALAQDDN